MTRTTARSARPPRAATRQKRTASRPAAKRTVEEYLAAAPKDKRATLEMFRRTIRGAAPTAQEYFAYGGLVGYKYRGKPLIYFGYAKEHSALYGGWVEEYADKLKEFVATKGSMRSTADHPMPQSLVRKIVKARMADVDRKLDAARG